MVLKSPDIQRPPPFLSHRAERIVSVFGKSTGHSPVLPPPEATDMRIIMPTDPWILVGGYPASNTVPKASISHSFLTQLHAPWRIGTAAADGHFEIAPCRVRGRVAFLIHRKRLCRHVVVIRHIFKADGTCSHRGIMLCFGVAILAVAPCAGLGCLVSNMGIRIRIDEPSGHDKSTAP